MKTYDKYEYQLFYFSEKAIKIRNYFGVLFINNNNNKCTPNEDNYNFAELSQKISVLTKKSRHYNLINKMIANEEALKVIVALLYKGFGWTNEIYETFNISKKGYVQKTLHTLQTLNLIVKENGLKINPYYHEALEFSKDKNLSKSLHQSEIYYITNEFVEFCELLSDLITFKVNTSTPFKFSLKNIVEDAKIFEDIYMNILNQEKSQFLRTKKTNEGVEYQQETIKARELRKALLEFKQELLKSKNSLGLLTDYQKQELVVLSNQSSQLAIIDDQVKSFRKNKKAIISYTPQLKDDEYMNDEEMEKSELVVGDPTLANETAKTLNGQEIHGYYLSKKGLEEYHKNSRQEDEFQKGLDFLDSLEVAR